MSRYFTLYILTSVCVFSIHLLTHSCPLCRVARRAAICAVSVTWVFYGTGSRLVGPLPFDLFGLGGPTRRRSSRRHSSRGSPRHSSPPTTTRWRSFEDVLLTVLYIHFLSTDKENLFNSQELL